MIPERGKNIYRETLDFKIYLRKQVLSYGGKNKGADQTAVLSALRELLRTHETFTVDQILRDFFA